MAQYVEMVVHFLLTAFLKLKIATYKSMTTLKSFPTAVGTGSGRGTLILNHGLFFS